MIEWLKSLPKTLFVTIVLGAGVLLIVLFNPPQTVCDSQVEQFHEAQKDFLFLDVIKQPKRKQTRFAKLIDTCKVTNSAGGCYELFYNLKKMLKDAGAVSPECFGKLKGHQGFSMAIWQSVDLMVKLAWGEKPPQSTGLKSGWFDPADLNLFCELKNSAVNVFTQDRWNEFAGEYFTTLPGASSLQRSDAWQKMLFSVNCASYL